jgi:hypothetical protein
MTNPDVQSDIENLGDVSPPNIADKPISHTPETLPDGITAVMATSYKVGPYSYSRLEDAMAELHRQIRAEK